MVVLPDSTSCHRMSGQADNASGFGLAFEFQTREAVEKQHTFRSSSEGSMGALPTGTYAPSGRSAA